MAVIEPNNICLRFNDIEGWLVTKAPEDLRRALSTGIEHGLASSLSEQKCGEMTYLEAWDHFYQLETLRLELEALYRLSENEFQRYIDCTTTILSSI